MLGGSPLRLFRLSAAGRRAFDEIAAGAPVAPSRLTEQLLDAGAIHPVRPEPEHPAATASARVRRHRRRADPRDGSGPLVRPAQPLPRHGRRDVRRRRLGHPDHRRAGRDARAPAPQLRSGGGAQRRRRAPPRRRSSPLSTPTSTSIPGGSTVCCGTSTIRGSASSRRGSPAGPQSTVATHGSPATSSATRRSTSAAIRRASSPAQGSATCRRPRCSCARTPSTRSADSTLAAVWRGCRRRLATERGRMAWPLRTGCRRPPPTPGDVAGAVRAAPRLRRVGGGARRPPRHAVAPVRMSPWTPRRVGSRRRREPVQRRRVGRGNCGWPSSPSSAACPPRSRCASPASATSPPAARWRLPFAGSGCRSSGSARCGRGDRDGSSLPRSYPATRPRRAGPPVRRRVLRRRCVEGRARPAPAGAAAARPDVVAQP